MDTACKYLCSAESAQTTVPAQLEQWQSVRQHWWQLRAKACLSAPARHRTVNRVRRPAERSGSEDEVDLRSDAGPLESWRARGDAGEDDAATVTARWKRLRQDSADVALNVCAEGGGAEAFMCGRSCS